MEANSILILKDECAIFVLGSEYFTHHLPGDMYQPNSFNQQQFQQQVSQYQFQPESNNLQAQPQSTTNQPQYFIHNPQLQSVSTPSQISPTTFQQQNSSSVPFHHPTQQELLDRAKQQKLQKEADQQQQLYQGQVVQPQQFLIQQEQQQFLIQQEQQQFLIQQEQQQLYQGQVMQPQIQPQQIQIQLQQPQQIQLQLQQPQQIQVQLQPPQQIQIQQPQQIQIPQFSQEQQKQLVQQHLQQQLMQQQLQQQSRPQQLQGTTIVSLGGASHIQPNVIVQHKLPTVMRHVTHTQTSNQPPFLSLSCVAHNKVQDCNSETHVEYCIVVNSNIQQYACHGTPYKVWRRYTQFNGLHSALLTSFCLPEMPPKNFFGQLDIRVIEERLKAFNSIMATISKTSGIWEKPSLLYFLDPTTSQGHC